MCKDWRVFVIMTVLLILVNITSYVLQQFEDVYPKWDWYRLMTCGFANVFGLSYTYKPKILANRIYYACMLISALIYAIFLVAYGQHFMAIPIYGNQISSVSEIVDKDYTWVGDSFALAQLYKQNKVTESIELCLLTLPQFYISHLTNRFIHRNYWESLKFVKILMFVCHNLIQIDTLRLLFH